MNDGIRKVIAESVDTALGLFNYVDREKFYGVLETKYGLKVEDIPVKYELFHKALSEIYGLEHFAVERKIVKVLHERAKIGVYDFAYEIPAFTVLVDSYIAEVNQTIIKYNAKIEKNLKTLDEIKETPA